MSLQVVTDTNTITPQAMARVPYIYQTPIRAATKAWVYVELREGCKIGTCESSEDKKLTD